MFTLGLLVFCELIGFIDILLVGCFSFVDIVCVLSKYRKYLEGVSIYVYNF